MKEPESVEELSTRIAISLIRRLLSEKDGHRECNTLSLRGSLGGDWSTEIDFGTFDVSNLSWSSRTESPTVGEQSVDTGVEEDEDALECQLAIARPRRKGNRSQLHRTPSDTNDDADSGTSGRSKRRKLIGGLRLAPTQQNTPRMLDEEPDFSTGRQLQTASRQLPQRKANTKDEHTLRPSTLNKLIMGIWEQIFSSMSFDMSVVVDEWREARTNHDLEITDGEDDGAQEAPVPYIPPNKAFNRMNVLCRKITQASRVSRALEVIVQARWIELFDEQVQGILRQRSDLSQTKAKMAALADACRDFSWTEKELRNKMAIWRGYKEIKDAGGWVCLVFAGMGIYRFCKYRISFDNEAMTALRQHHSRFEVAADTLHPHWREMLSIVDAASPRKYSGHPHDWVVSDCEDPVPLGTTYLRWNPNFSFSHLDASVVDANAWGATDPRLISFNSEVTTTACQICGEIQSDVPKENGCKCFPTLYGCATRPPSPVQVFRTKNGRNNGLVACVTLDRGTAVGEFVGLVTNGLDGTDVMQMQTELGNYQIWQGREGNHTRFVNHSCRPNSQFQRFTWLGTQRVILVSKGIEAGAEITTDYSDSYWRNLDKDCLCNEPCCRFKDRQRTRQREQT